MFSNVCRTNCSQRVEFNRHRGIRVNLSHKDTKGQKINSKQRVFNVRIKNVGRSKGIGKRKADRPILENNKFSQTLNLSTSPELYNRNFCILLCQLDLTRSRTCWYHRECRQMAEHISPIEKQNCRHKCEIKIPQRCFDADQPNHLFNEFHDFYRIQLFTAIIIY